jgi:hypothetical protein
MAIVLNGATSGNVTIDANAISGTSVITLPVGSGTFPLMTLSTAVATTSGTAIDFTSIPSWVKKITVMFNGISTNGSSVILIQIGDSGGVETTGYTSGGSSLINGAVVQASNTVTTGFAFSNRQASTYVYYGHTILTLIDSINNTWVASGTTSSPVSGESTLMGGVKSTSSTLDRIRLTTTNGTDTFDAGSVNILMEGY